MKTTTEAATDGQKSATQTGAASSLQLHCKVLVNGMIHAEAHHAAGKLMAIPKEAAEYLAGMNPPQVEILGTA